MNPNELKPLEKIVIEKPKTKNKIALKIGDNVIFNTGNYAGLTGVILEVDWNSLHKNAIHGFYHTVQLSNGNIGHIEKSEHWDFLHTPKTKNMPHEIHLPKKCPHCKAVVTDEDVRIGVCYECNERI